MEFGCGGGHQLIPLYINDRECVGVDISKDVIERAIIYTQNIDEKFTAKGTIKIIVKDFIEYDPNELFDMTFQFGVLEHFIDDCERIRYLKKCLNVQRCNIVCTQWESYTEKNTKRK